MKNFDAKKLLVFILIIALVALIGFGVFKLIQGVSKPSNKEQEATETLAVKYYLNLTSGYSTVYNGMDVLFSKDKYTLEDVSLESRYNTCIQYAMDNKLDLFPEENVKNLLQLGKNENVIVYKADALNEASKVLFGKEIKFDDATDEDFMNSYYYSKEYNVVVAEMKKVENTIESQNSIDYKIVSTKKEGKDIITTVAIAYVANLADGTYTYSSTSDYSKIVATGVGEFKIPEDKVDQFPKYKITMTKSNDNYIFKSIEKTDK